MTTVGVNMLDGNTAAELQNDLRQSDADQVLEEIERELKREADEMIGTEAGMEELLLRCGPNVIPKLLAILSQGRRPADLMRAVDEMNAYLLDVASNMLREEVTQRVMEERQCVEYGYED